jgi:hypothetical protein
LSENGTARPLLLIYEPWCWTDELAPDAVRVCEATSPLPGTLEVEYTTESITVAAWDACIARVLDAQGNVIGTLDIRVPSFRELGRPAEKDR